MATAARPTARHAKYEVEEDGVRLHAVDLTQYAHANWAKGPLLTRTAPICTVIGIHGILRGANRIPLRCSKVRGDKI